MGNIYTKFGKKDSIQEFIFNLFSYRDGYCLFSVETYYDEECKIQQCRRNTYRSIDDLYEILNTYYTINYEELLHYLLMTRISINDNIKYPNFIFCEDTDLFTMCFGGYLSSFDSLEEDDIDYSETSISSISWYELFFKLNIKSQEDLDYYLEKHKNEIKIFDYETL